MKKERTIASAASVLRIYWTFTMREWPMVVVLLISLVGALAAEIIAPLYLKQFLNVLIENASSADFSKLLTLLGYLSVAWFIGWVMITIRYFSLAALEVRVMEALGTHAFDRLIGHSHDFFSSNFAGALTHKVNKFGRAYEALVDSVITSFLPAIIFISSAIVIVWMNHTLLGITLAAWVSFSLGLQLYLSHKRNAVRAERAETETKVTATLADAISNHSTIQLFAGAAHEKKRVHNILLKWRDITLSSWQFDMSIWSSMSLLSKGTQISVLGVGLYLWTKGQFTVGDFVLIQLYLLTTFERLNSISRELRRVYDSYYDAAEMVAIIETPYSVPDKPQASELVVRNGEITFEKVGFHFHANKSVLTDLSMRIPGGQKVALVGLSGAGKSTITKLLLRLYDVTDGAVCIDGKNISEVTQDSLRTAVAFVPQEPILFHRSLMDNIRYGRRDATDEEVYEAARKAHCHEFISKLQHGYETFVGERGIKLSGGERQRVAIARALLKNAPILVLDEATSSLDSESEALIQDALETLMQGKTVLVIAHRLSTIMKMDRIIVLEQGNIVEDGTHSELLEKAGLYKKLWDIQSGGFIADEDEEESAKEEE